KYDAITTVDFKNMTLNLLDRERTVQSFKLRNGVNRFRDDIGIALGRPWNNEITLRSVVYLTAGNASHEYALVFWDWFSASGSSTITAVSQLFALHDRDLRVVQQITSDPRFNSAGPHRTFNKQTNTLEIRSTHYMPGDPHCCVSAVDIVIFKWNGE